MKAIGRFHSTLACSSTLKCLKQLIMTEVYTVRLSFHCVRRQTEVYERAVHV